MLIAQDALTIPHRTLLVGSGVLAVSLLVSFLVSPAPAQTGMASVRGTVHDTSGAVVPGAKVKLTHIDTATAYETTTNGVGFYLLPGLEPGRCLLSVEAPGMQNWEGQLSIQAAEAVAVDPELKVRGTTTAVTVTSDVTNLVNVENGTVGVVLEHQRIEELPLNGRSINTLIQSIVPGIEGSSSRMRPFGLNAAGFEVVWDGAMISNRDYGGILNRPTGLDAVEEFRAETNNPSAKMNRPGTVILRTRSGTNQFHGTMFEAARNNGLGVARQRQDYYTKPPHLVRNEFGFSIGGPVYLPKLYDGRNRTFFFFNYEDYRNRTTTSSSVTVPTQAMRGGDFSGLVDSTGRTYTIYDPWTTAGSTWQRLPFAKNQIPISRISPLAKYLYAITPLPNLPGVNPMVASNLVAPAPSVTNQDTLTFKVDHNISSHDHMFARYSQAYRDYMYAPSASYYPTNNRETNIVYDPMSSRSAVVSLVKNISPTFFSETALNWSYNWEGFAGGLRGNWDQQLGLPNPLGGSLFPDIENTGFYQYMQGGNERDNRTWVINLDQDFTNVRGRHELQFGGRFRQERVFQIPDSLRSGMIDFSGAQTGLYDPTCGTAYCAVSLTGHPSANLFLGLANSYSNSFQGLGMFRIGDREYSGYFQDNWRVHPRLTLNLGVRYEYHPGLSERNGLFVGFDANSKSVILGRPLADLYGMGDLTPAIVSAYTNIGVKYITPKQAGLPADLIYPDPWNILPRSGFAYKLTSGAKPTVLRGGFGIFAYPPPVRNFYANLRQSAPFVATFNDLFNDASTSPDGKANYALRSVPQYVAGVNTSNLISYNNLPTISRGGFSTYYMDPHQPTTRVPEWNMTLEREIYYHIVARAAYVGNHGYNLEQWAVFNQSPSSYIWYATTGQPLPTGAYASVATRNFDQTTYGPIYRYQKSGWSNCSGIQLGLERRYKSVGFQFFYVMSNALRAGGNGWTDDPLPDTNVFMPGAVPTDPQERNRFLNYSRDTEIAKHRVRWNWLVDLPAGRGKKFGHNAGRLTDSLIGGWQLAGFGNLRSNYWSLPTDHWGTFGQIQIYGTKYKIEDCRSGTCFPGYLYWNGYIPANRINSYDAQGRPNGVMGVPSSYKPAYTPLIPMPATPIPGDPNAPYYDTDTVWVKMANGQLQRVTYNSNLHPWRNQVVPGPMSFNVDASLFKNVRITERVNLRINADFFNVFNMPGLSQPDSSTGILSLQLSAQSPRQLQLAMRLSW